MPRDAITRSVAPILQGRTGQKYTSALHPVRLSLFALAYIVAYAYGNLFVQTSPAPLWFPDSVLLCALLLSALNEWWIYLAIAAVIRLYPIHHLMAPLWFVLTMWANDFAKAILAAYLLRRLPNGSRHPSTMPQLATFLGVAVFFVPAFSAFAGAPTRYWIGGGFWIAWYQWFLGDALANLILTPALLYWSSKQFRALRPRTAELALWIGGFALALPLALTLAHSAYAPIAVCVPVPFLIWAAARFGLIGASTSLSATALLATAIIAEKNSLFSMGFESKSLLFMQLFLFVISIPVLCIAVLMKDTTSAEKSLRESEQTLRLAVDAGRMFAYSWDAATDAIERSGEAEAILGVKSDEATTGTAAAAMVHADDKERLGDAVAKLTPNDPTLQIAYRVIRPDGTVRWLQRNSRAYFDEHARLSRIIGMIADITEQKLAEQALSDMTKKLIDSQEQERARIARELHDDITQRLAILSVEVEQLQANPTEIETRVEAFRKRIGDISADVQGLSHDLHSSKLEYLGIVAGMRSWCREFAGRQKLEIEFRSDVSSELTLQTGLCVFRVAQEALHNAMKPSGTKCFEVP